MEEPSLREDLALAMMDTRYYRSRLKVLIGAAVKAVLAPRIKIGDVWYVPDEHLEELRELVSGTDV